MIFAFFLTQLSWKSILYRTVHILPYYGVYTNESLSHIYFDDAVLILESDKKWVQSKYSLGNIFPTPINIQWKLFSDIYYYCGQSEKTTVLVQQDVEIITRLSQKEIGKLSHIQKPCSSLATILTSYIYRHWNSASGTL